MSDIAIGAAVVLSLVGILMALRCVVEIITLIEKCRKKN